MAAAPDSRLNNGFTEDGPLGLNVHRLPLDMVEAFLEVGVETLSDLGLCEAFPADPHVDTFMHEHGVCYGQSLTSTKV